MFSIINGSDDYFKVISSRECRMYAILIGILVLVLAVWGGMTGSGKYPRWYLALFCGWILIWPMARIAGYLMNSSILANIQERIPQAKDAIENYKKLRRRKTALNSEFMIDIESLKQILAYAPEIDVESVIDQRNAAQKVVLVWTYAYCALIPVIVISSLFIWK